MWEEARRRSLVLARHYAYHVDDVEDIAQEALLRAWQHRRNLRSQDSFYAWLAVIVRNEAARCSRRRPVITNSEEAVDEGVEDSHVVMTPERVDLRRELSRLSPHERRLLELRYQEDRTQAAIAEETGVPEGTVKVHLHRARAKLHRALSER